MDKNKNGQQRMASIPCAKCGVVPARIECGVQVTAFGLGEIRVYLCRTDYESVLQKQQMDQAELDVFEQKAAQFQQMCQEVAAIGLRLHRGQWPPRHVLWNEHRSREKQYEEARNVYRQADDSTTEGKLARLRLLRLAGLCLYEAICIEAAARQEGADDSVINGTLTRMTYAFLKGGLTIPQKTITREQAIAAMLALLRYRASSPENEEEECEAIASQISQ